MKLTTNEIKYLSQSFVPQTPLSLFGNIEGELQGNEHRTLVEKGVIVGAEYSPEALDLLMPLINPQGSARFLAQTPNYMMEKYTYRTGDNLILAENDAGEIKLSRVEDPNLLAPEFTEVFGMSVYSSTEIAEEFSRNEMIVFLAIVDLVRKSCFREYSDMPEEDKKYSKEDIIREVKGDYKNGLKGMFTQNYGVPKLSDSEIEDSVKSLLDNGFILQDGDKYSLTEEYMKFASNFLVIDTIGFYEAFWLLPTGETATMAKLVSSAGKNDIVVFLYDIEGGMVRMNTVSGLSLIYGIEAVMSCPEYRYDK